MATTTMNQPENARGVSLLFRLWSGFYDHPIPQQLFYRRVHHRILEHWNPAAGEKVLDVGCGTGLFLKSLARDYKGLDLTGLDFSEDMLAQARQNGSRSGRVRSEFPDFVHGSVYEMPFETGAFDVVLNTISCHFYLEQVKAFAEVQRVMKSGGRFYCAAMTVRSEIGRRTLANTAVHYPPRMLRNHLEQAGFKVVGQDQVFPRVTLLISVKP